MDILFHAEKCTNQKYATQLIIKNEYTHVAPTQANKLKISSILEALLLPLLHISHPVSKSNHHPNF